MIVVETQVSIEGFEDYLSVLKAKEKHLVEELYKTSRSIIELEQNINKHKNPSIYSILEKLRNKACCTYSQRQSSTLFNQLRQTGIDSRDYTELNTEHSHWELGEGADKFYDVIKRLKEKYK